MTAWKGSPMNKPSKRRSRNLPPTVHCAVDVTDCTSYGSPGMSHVDIVPAHVPTCGDSTSRTDERTCASAFSIRSSNCSAACFSIANSPCASSSSDIDHSSSADRARTAIVGTVSAIGVKYCGRHRIRPLAMLLGRTDIGVVLGERLVAAPLVIPHSASLGGGEAGLPAANRRGVAVQQPVALGA